MRLDFACNNLDPLGYCAPPGHPVLDLKVGVLYIIYRGYDHLPSSGYLILITSNNFLRSYFGGLIPANSH